MSKIYLTFQFFERRTYLRDWFGVIERGGDMSRKELEILELRRWSEEKLASSTLSWNRDRLLDLSQYDGKGVLLQLFKMESSSNASSSIKVQSFINSSSFLPVISSTSFRGVEEQMCLISWGVFLTDRHLYAEIRLIRYKRHL